MNSANAVASAVRVTDPGLRNLPTADLAGLSATAFSLVRSTWRFGKIWVSGGMP